MYKHAINLYFYNLADSECVGIDVDAIKVHETPYYDEAKGTANNSTSRLQHNYHRIVVADRGAWVRQIGCSMIARKLGLMKLA